MRIQAGRADFLLGIVVLVLAGSVILSKIVLDQGWPPLAYAALRFTTAGLLLVPLVGRLGGGVGIGVGDTIGAILASRKATALMGVCLVALVFNQVGSVFALQGGPAAIVGLVFGTSPVFVAVIALTARTDRLGRVFIVAAGTSISGVAVIALAQQSGGVGGISTVLLALLMTVGFAVHSVSAMPLMRRHSAIAICALSFFGAGLVLLGLAVPLSDWAALGTGPGIWLCFFATIAFLILGNTLFLTAARSVGPSHAALFINLQPFVAALLAVLVLGESLTGLDLVGGLLIVCGVAIAWRRQHDRELAYADDPV